MANSTLLSRSLTACHEMQARQKAPVGCATVISTTGDVGWFEQLPPPAPGPGQTLYSIYLRGQECPPWQGDREHMMTYYLISDLHIGGDGVLDHCDFETELIDFLRDLERTSGDVELIIVGDAFGLWELTRGTGPEKLDHIAANHRALFAQFRQTGKRIKITLLPGNHDYELACYRGFADRLAEYNIHLEPQEHIERTVGARKIWIEHGNQHDGANRFPNFGDPYGLPVGYFITADVVGATGRRATHAGSSWLGGLHSVYPTEEVPLWVVSNYFYREMGRVLRWCLVPFLLLATFSAIVVVGRTLETVGVLHTTIFHSEPFRNYGLPGRLIDWVLWANGTVISFALLLAGPVYLLARDIRATLRRYGIKRQENLKQAKDHKYVEAAQAVFRADPAVALFIYGHTHAVSVRPVDGRYIINTGTWLKRLERVRPRFGWLPSVFIPSFRLNYFVVSDPRGGLRVQYRTIPKRVGDELTWLQKAVLLWRRPAKEEPIPAEFTVGSSGD